MKPQTPKRSGYKTYVEPAAEREKYVSPSRNGKSILHFLSVYGVCILPDMFSKEECKGTFDQLISETEEHISNFQYKNVDSWPRIREAKATHGMILQNFGLGWLQSIVNFRSKRRLIRVFRNLFSYRDYDMFGRKGRYGKRDMFSSADGFSLYLNPDYTRKLDGTYVLNRAGYHRGGHDWLHWDQKPGDSTTLSVQSFVNLLEADDERRQTATFAFLESSHKFQKDFDMHFWGDEEDRNPRFFRLENQAHYDFFFKKCHCSYKMLRLEAGDMVLWDSRLIHQGRVGVKPESYQRKIGGGMKRCVIYVSMQPKCYASKIDKKRKKMAFSKLCTTTHNAASGVELFNKKPRVYNVKEKHDLEAGLMARCVHVAPRLTRLQKSLFGVD